MAAEAVVQSVDYDEIEGEPDDEDQDGDCIKGRGGSGQGPRQFDELIYSVEPVYDDFDAAKAFSHPRPESIDLY